MQDRTETSRAVGKENIAKFQKSAIWPSLTQSPCKMLPRAQLRTKHGRRGALFPIAPGALCRDSTRALRGLLAKRREYFRKTGASIAERLAKLLRPARGAPLSIEQDTAGEDLANSCVERQKAHDRQTLPPPCHCEVPAQTSGACSVASRGNCLKLHLRRKCGDVHNRAAHAAARKPLLASQISAGACGSRQWM